MHRIHAVLVAALAALALSAAAAGCKGHARPGEAELPPASGAGSPPRPPLPSLADDAVAAGVVASDTTGTTFPRARAEMGPPLSAVIASVEVAEGDRVKKGQVLFRLRTTDIALRAQQARAAAAAAQVNLASVRVEYDRAVRLLDKRAIEQAQLDRARAQLDAAEAAVDQARVGVSMARQAMDDAEVVSPIDGVVTAKLKSAGEMATMMPPTVVVVVEDHSALELRFRLPESRLGALAAGAEVTASFAGGQPARQARVLRIAPSVDPATRTVEVVAMIDNQGGGLRSGMLATVGLPGSSAPAASPPPPASAVKAARP